MQYSKPQIIAQNAAQKNYAAGCPAQGRGGGLFGLLNCGGSGCKNCERTK
ncbi:hypothetical protein LQZ19_12505 [Treponema primitia]